MCPTLNPPCSLASLGLNLKESSGNELELLKVIVSYPSLKSRPALRDW